MQGAYLSFVKVPSFSSAFHGGVVQRKCHSSNTTNICTIWELLTKHVILFSFNSTLKTYDFFITCTVLNSILTLSLTGKSLLSFWYSRPHYSFESPLSSISRSKSPSVTATHNHAYSSTCRHTLVQIFGNQRFTATIMDSFSQFGLKDNQIRWFIIGGGKSILCMHFRRWGLSLIESSHQFPLLSS